MTIGLVKELVNTFGLPIGLLFVMIYQDFRRRKIDEKERLEMKQRITSIEDYQRNKLEKIVVENTTASQNCSEALNNVIHVTQKNNEFLNDVVIASRNNLCVTRAIQEIDKNG